MPTDSTLVRRVTDVEAAVAAIQERLTSQPLPRTSDWVERFLGAFEDEPAFAEGRTIRPADRSQVVEG